MAQFKEDWTEFCKRRNNVRVLFVFAASIWATLIFVSESHSVGEMFEGRFVGTEYCGDYFYRYVDEDVWLWIYDEDVLIVSFTRNFQEGTYLPLYGYYYVLSPRKAAFVGGILFPEDYSYLTIYGTALLTRSGMVRKMSGIYIEDSVYEFGCFSSGKFYTSDFLGIYSISEGPKLDNAFIERMKRKTGVIPPGPKVFK